MNDNYEITNERVIIKTAIPFISLLSMEIYEKENTHGSLILQVIVNESNQQEILNKNWYSTQILVLEKEKESMPLFNGRIEKLICKQENQLLIVELSGIGETIFLDKEKKKRSFQNPEMTYKQIIRELIHDYKEVDFIWQAGEDRKIGNPLIQYEETDWKFLMRLCSHFNKILFPDLRIGYPKFFFGIGSGKEQKMDKIEIVEYGFDSAYYQNGCYEDGIPRSRVFYLEIKSKENWQVGDFIFYKEERYQVYRRTILFKDGTLFFVYRLGTSETYYQKKVYNKILSGIRIEGTIKKTQKEFVYLQLDIDKRECADYPWLWKPETNNLCYCMPEEETKATLYLPTEEEKDGIVILSVIDNQKNSSYTNPQNREFVTKFHKKIGLYPDKLFLENLKKAVTLSMTDMLGIELCSNEKISFQADGEIFLEGKNIVVNAPFEVVCKTPKSNIEICRDFNLYAPNGVQTVGMKKEEKKQEVINSGKKKQEVEHWQASYSAINAIPMADFDKIQAKEDMLDFYANGAVPKIARGSATIALSEVMDGKKEKESTFPEALQSMENYTVKGGYFLPGEQFGTSQEQVPNTSVIGAAIQNVKNTQTQVLCTCAIKKSKSVKMLRDGKEVEKPSDLVRTNIQREKAFDGCKILGKCINNKDYIEDKKWQIYNDRVRQGENKEVLNKEYSYMICTKGYGLIYFKDAEQGFINILKGMYMSYLSKDYIKWLKEAEGYVPYPYADKADKKSSKAKKNVTLGIGFTFDNKKTNWDILKKVLRWTDDDIKAIIKGVYSGVDYSNSKYRISKKNVYKLLKELEKRKRKHLNACIKAYNDKNNTQMTYSQQQLEAMFDYAYNNGLNPTEDTGWKYSSKVNDRDTIIYYYIRKEKKGGVDAVKRFANDTRRRLNQMNLFFYGDYNFDDDLNSLRKKLGFPTKI